MSIKTIEPAVEIEVFFSGQFVVQAGVLEDNSYGSSDLVLLAGHVVPADGCTPPWCGENRRKDGQQGSFSRAVGTQETEKLTLPDLEINILQGLEISKTFA